ncbi:hypothetical protein F5Y18DRAFT_431918 [Xylariaceae sp. FL1019]|nr:hypothetical protein F5Y18DRAFT_431918 [Xylariaceae sp. FL1019]
MSGSERNPERHVSFSGSRPLPLRSAMRHTTHDHPRDSGIGSSSSDHTSTSGNLDERFTAREFNIHSADPSTLREAYGALQERLESEKTTCHNLNLECRQLRLEKRDLENDFRKQCDHSNSLAAQVQDLKQRLEDVSLEGKSWADRYYKLHNETHGIHSPTYMSGESGESSHGESSRKQKDRMKDRINRDTPESPRHSRSSHPPDALKPPKKTTRGHSRSASDRTPYIEPMPKAGSSSRHSHSHSAPRSSHHRGSANEPATITRRGSVTISIPRTVHREPGDYSTVDYPLPDHPRR